MSEMSIGDVDLAIAAMKALLYESGHPSIPEPFAFRMPLPRGFMPLWFDGIARHEHQCHADPWAPDSDHVYSYAPNGDGRLMVLASHRTWTKLGAVNLASAYRPEGIR